MTKPRRADNTSRLLTTSLFGKGTTAWLTRFYAPPHPGFYVYIHRRATDGSVFYVGKGKGHRAWQIAGRSAYWTRIATKYGRLVEIVQDGMQEWWALEMERDLIALHGREILCNLTDGGETSAGYRFTEEAKAKISAGNKGKKKTPEQLAKLKFLFNQEAHRAKLSAALDNDEVRAAKLRAASRRKGMPITDAQRAVLAKMNSPEIRAKAKEIKSRPEYKAAFAKIISKATKGKVFAPHILAAAKAANSKRFICNETGTVFPAVEAAAVWLRSQGRPKANAPSLRNAAIGRHKQAYGYTWSYAPAE